jgi:uncharacterized membrane protein YeaQ/YmgE (transglycosylase-associated protein family)
MGDGWSLLLFLLIGLLAGYLAGMIWKGSGFGWVWDLIIGVAGAFIGGLLFSFFPLPLGGIPPLMVQLVSAVVGALLLLFILSKLKFR